jgi:hypothetical protein
MIIALVLWKGKEETGLHFGGSSVFVFTVLLLIAHATQRGLAICMRRVADLVWDWFLSVINKMQAFSPKARAITGVLSTVFIQGFSKEQFITVFVLKTQHLKSMVCKERPKLC